MSRCLCNFIRVSLCVSKWVGEWVSESVTKWVSVKPHIKYFSYCSMTSKDCLESSLALPSQFTRNKNYVGRPWLNDTWPEIYSSHKLIICTLYICLGKPLLFVFWSGVNEIESGLVLQLLCLWSRVTQDPCRMSHACPLSHCFFRPGNRVFTGCGAETKSIFKKKERKKSGVHVCHPNRGRLTISTWKDSALHAGWRYTM